MKRLFLTIKALLCIGPVFLIAGCFLFQSVGSYEGDISHISKVWGGYKSDVQYQLQKPAFLLKTTDETLMHVMAVPADARDQDPEVVKRPDDIPTLEQYERSPDAWGDVRGVVPAGTRIQCSRIIKQGVWPNESHLIYYAVIRDGGYKDLEIEINALSHIFNCECTPITLKPNPELLKLYPSP